MKIPEVPMPPTVRLLRELARHYPDAASDPDARVVRAPGRVNLMGEHTDYNAGLVLPAAISLALELAFVPTDDQRVEIFLEATGESAGFDLTAIGSRRGDWLDYIAGTAWALGEAGVRTRGFRGLLASTLPAGAGLSSSAALELATAWALTGPEGPGLDPMALAQTAQHAENAFVGVQCGLMDQFAVTMGRAGSALRLDCRSLDWRTVPIPWGLEIVVVNSGSTRRLESSAYNARRAECGRAVAAIGACEDGITTLRDVTRTMLTDHRDAIDDVAFARALHVVAENERVDEVEAALRADDRPALGRLFAESHASMRDLFESSSPALDALVEIAGLVPGVVAARMTGGGFGGCTVNLVERGRVDELRVAVERDYPALTGLSPVVYVVDTADGAGLVGGPARMAGQSAVRTQTRAPKSPT